MKFWIAALLASFLVLALMFLPGSNARVAQAQDYCGTALFDVPDSGATFDFSAACQAHDACYAQYHGTNETLRKMCDDQFLADMTSWCKTNWHWWQAQYYSCLSVAGTYYSGVRVGGWLFFYG